MDDTNMFNCLSLPYQSIMNQCNLNERHFYTVVKSIYFSCKYIWSFINN